jgi:D-threo-aldose 1-dehydrogenase
MYRRRGAEARRATGVFPRRRIGRTSLEVTTLGFGGNALGNLYAEIDETEAREAVHAAWQTGVAYFDTAPLYGHGLSERRIGDVLRALPRDQIVLSTKVGRLLKPHGRVPPPKLSISQGGIFTGELPFLPRFDFSYDATMRSMEDSLQRLGMSRVDILLIHDCDEWSQGAAYAEALRTVEHGALKALMRLKEEGTIAAFGAGVNQAEACERLMDIGPFDCFMLAGRYTLLEQGGLDGFLPKCVHNEVSVILAAPYNSGILATGAVPEARYNYMPAPSEILERVRRIEKVTRAHGIPLAAAALQFVLGHPAVAAVIPGSRSRAEAEQNADLMRQRITASFWSDLKTEGLLPKDALVPAS